VCTAEIATFAFFNASRFRLNIAQGLHREEAITLLRNPTASFSPNNAWLSFGIMKICHRNQPCSLGDRSSIFCL
jgi:alpha-D-ribose 1-methylphosphonate 5-triphosphate synthase subunit PhnL